MNYSNQPTYSVMPWIPQDVRPLFDVTMLIFIVWFFAGIHYRMHVQQHLVPPFYIVWIADLIRKWFRQ